MRKCAGLVCALVFAAATLCVGLVSTDETEISPLDDSVDYPLLAETEGLTSLESALERRIAAANRQHKGSGARERQQELLHAMKHARQALATERRRPTRANEAAARVAVTQVEHLTVQLEAAMGMDKKGEGITPQAAVPSPMAGVKVNSHPRSAQVDYPALNLKMSTKKGIDLLSPTSNTQAAWGGSIASARARVLKADRKNDRKTMAEFPLLQNVLSKNGRGHGFGKIRARATPQQMVRPSGQREGKSGIKDAKRALKKLGNGGHTPDIVKHAINTLAKLAGSKGRSTGNMKTEKARIAELRIKKAGARIHWAGKVIKARSEKFHKDKVRFSRSELGKNPKNHNTKKKHSTHEA